MSGRTGGNTRTRERAGTRNAYVDDLIAYTREARGRKKKEERERDVRARSALRKCLLASSGLIRLLMSSSSGFVVVPLAAALALVRAVEGSSSLESAP